ncbi:MAG: putative DNA binding domain-containing protein [Bifidobacteriaceae bacterium]|jgi:ATP-dependent DNA helicase RecG|nr:putative DNA binding domain-containing protein [Bifidobacteriaceae bacterium]
MRDHRAIDALTLPGEQAVQLLTRLPEDQWFERKSGRITPRDLAVPLVAMANAEGGCVVVGIHSGKAEPMDSAKLSAVRQTAVDFTSPTVHIHVHEIAVTGGGIALIEVEPGTALHETVSGEAYLRIGDESHRLTFAERRELVYERGSEVFSATVLRNTGVKDLDQAAIQAYQETIGASSASATLAARDLSDENGNLRVAAWLMFGKHPNIGFPNARIRVLRYADTARGTGSALTLESGHDISCDGRLPDQIEAAEDLIEQWMPQRQALSARGLFEDQPMIPREAWEEGLVNAAIHRSYANQGDHIRVEIFPNRVEISSPGRFPGLADTTHPESIRRYARNPRIARACAELGQARELGEGIKRMFAAMRARGLALPAYVQTSGSVILTLSGTPAPPEELAPAARAILLAMRQAGGPLRTGDIAQLAGIARPTALRHLAALRDAGLIAWTGTTPRDPSATWSVA